MTTEKFIPADKCWIPQSFWRAVERLGVAPAALLQRAGLSAPLHVGTHQFVRTQEYFTLWRALDEMTGQTDLWIRFVEATISSGQPWFVAACYAAGYRDALVRIAHFKSHCMPEVVDVQEQNGEIAISTRWLYATGPEPPPLVDASFAFMVALGRHGSGQHITPVRVDFARAGPSGDVHRDFFGCPVRHNAERNTLLMKASDLELAFPGHNAELLDILSPALTTRYDEGSQDTSYAELVKVVLKRTLSSGRPEVAKVALELGTTERTLQRRITSEGHTFRALLIEARRELAKRLLSDPSTEIINVAGLLGYEDVTSFYRAFRSWEGITPSRWRELNSSTPRR
ncbi:MAG: AraC family transcriptional regulator [Pseudoxanthomonas sp.]|nr:AraC family transcriptional regulator [Pseudoxanthomonas sp.]